MFSQILLLFFGCIFALSSVIYDCPENYITRKTNGINRCYRVYKAKHTVDRCQLIDYCRDLHPEAIPATVPSASELEFMKTIVDPLQFTLIGVHIPCPQKEWNMDSFVNIDGTPLPVPLEVANNWGHENPEYFGMLAYDKLDDVSGRNMYVDNHVLCVISLSKRPLPDATPEPNPETILQDCPDNSYVRKEFNGVHRCYTVYGAKDRPDRCKFIDYCRSLHPAAIPAPIHSIEELEFMKTLVNPKEFTLIGVHVPCPQKWNKDSFVNVDGTPLPVPLEVANNWGYDRDPEYLAMLSHNKTDDVSGNNVKKFHNYVLCAITLTAPNTKLPPKPTTKPTLGPSTIPTPERTTKPTYYKPTAEPKPEPSTKRPPKPKPEISLQDCPDYLYIREKFNGVHRCYTVYQAKEQADRCSFIDYCRSLHPAAIPAPVHSIEELEFMKTMVYRQMKMLIGVYIPCTQKEWNKDSFVNVDGTPLPVSLEFTNNNEGNEYFGTLAHNLTEDINSRNSHLPNFVLCAITLSAPPSEPPPKLIS